MNRISTTVSWIASLFPIIWAVCLIRTLPGERLGYVGLSIVVGVVSTLFVIFVHLLTLPSSTRHQTKLIEYATAPLVWGLNSLVLLTLAVDFFNRAFHGGHGIHWLNDDGPKVGPFSVFEVTSGVVSIMVVVVLFVFPRLFWPTQTGDHRLSQLWLQVTYTIPWLGAGIMVLFIAIVVLMVAVAAESALLDRTAAFLAAPLSIVKEFMATLGVSGRVDVSGRVEWWQAFLALVALIFVLERHFARKSKVEETVSLGFGERAGCADSLRLMVLTVAILPPLIGALGVVRGRMDLGLAIVYGLFVYGGHTAWTVGIELVSTRKPRMPALVFKPAAIFMIVLVFIYAGLLTVLWVTVFDWIQRWVDERLGLVFNTALGVVLIQVVYGHLYRRTWGYRLSDQWPGDRPNYIIFAVILGLCVAAAPQEYWKPWIVVSFVCLSVIYPGYRFRRRLAAYILIRVAPGCTEAVQEALDRQEVATAVVYGSQDMIAHVDLPQAGTKGESLLELATLIKEKIRRIEGFDKAGNRVPLIRETETLVDFSHLASFRHVAEGDDAEMPHSS